MLWRPDPPVAPQALPQPHTSRLESGYPGRYGFSYTAQSRAAAGRKAPPAKASLDTTKAHVFGDVGWLRRAAAEVRHGITSDGLPGGDMALPSGVATHRGRMCGVGGGWMDGQNPAAHT